MFKKIISIATLIFTFFIGEHINSKEKKIIKTEKLSPLEVYKPNFWIFGNKSDQVYAQISYKYSIFRNYHTGVFLAYSQYMDWKLYNKSAPFYDINYNPEVFIKSKYFIEELDYIQFSPYEHMSNGRDSKSSRSIDRAYIQAQWSTGYDLVFGVNLKAFVFYSQEKCDYMKYTKMYETDIFLTLGYGNKTKEEFHCRFSGFNKGWIELGFLTRKLGLSNVRIYLQMKHGYMHNMMDWNKKETRFRAGLLFK